MTELDYLVIYLFQSKRSMEKLDKQELISQAALRLFARYGIRKTTIDDIAKNAGIAKGTIYLYFRSKEEIFADALKSLGKQLLSTLEEAINGQETSDKKLYAFILARLHFHEELIHLLGATANSQMEFESYLLTHPKLQQTSRTYFERERNILINLLDQGVAKGEFFIEKSRIPKIARIVCPALEAMDRSWFNLDTVMTSAEQAEVFTHLLIQGIGKK